MQISFFEKKPQTFFFPPAGEIFFHPGFLENKKADVFKKKILEEILFEVGDIVIHGKKIKQPRLIAWCGETQYSYSGYTAPKQPFAGAMRELLAIAKDISQTPLNGCLLNLYRNNFDSVGWHSDDETNLGKKSTIVSLSFGDYRVFKIRSKKRKKESHYFELGHGDLIIMRGDLQQHWEHCVHKTTQKKSLRLNLTFRRVL